MVNNSNTRLLRDVRPLMLTKPVRPLGRNRESGFSLRGAAGAAAM
jgi:hypothetical protein